MCKYGDVAVNAAKTANESKCPIDLWNEQVEKIFPSSKSSREKPCPKYAFLGLCEAGLVKGINNNGCSTSGSAYKSHALKAVSLLKQTPSLARNKSELWRRVTSPDTTKSNNRAMDVVVALWQAGMIL